MGGRVGKAVRFRFEADAPSAFFSSNIHGKPEWDRALGFSSWVRGNGSDKVIEQEQKETVTKRSATP